MDVAYGFWPAHLIVGMNFTPSQSVPIVQPFDQLGYYVGVTIDCMKLGFININAYTTEARVNSK